MSTETVIEHPVKKTLFQMIQWWRSKYAEERTSEASTYRHGMHDQSKWHEGRADMLEFCADQIEYSIMRPDHSIFTRCFSCQTFGINQPNESKCGNCGSDDTCVYLPIGKAAPQ
jgi:hypothetical protein